MTVEPSFDTLRELPNLKIPNYHHHHLERQDSQNSALSVIEDLDGMSKHQFASRFFETSLANEEGFANGRDIAAYFRNYGLIDDDP